MECEDPTVANPASETSSYRSKLAACTAAPKSHRLIRVAGLGISKSRTQGKRCRSNHPGNKVPVELYTTLELLRDSRGRDNESLAHPTRVRHEDEFCHFVETAPHMYSFSSLVHKNVRVINQQGHQQKHVGVGLTKYCSVSALRYWKK